MSYTLKALFKSQPFAALDTFLPPAPSDFGAWMFEGHTHMGNPINDVDPAILHEWASRDSATRYPLLGTSLGMFGKKKGEDETDFSPIFLSLLSKAPDKQLFLGDLWHRLHPRSWSGSLADILISRKTQLATLAKHPDEQVRAWIEDALPKLDCWIEHERGRDRVSEESFE